MQFTWNPMTPTDEFSFAKVIPKLLVSLGEAEDAFASINAGTITIEIRPASRTSHIRVAALLGGLDLAARQANAYDSTITADDLPRLAASIGHGAAAYPVVESLYCRIRDRRVRIDLSGDRDGWDLTRRRQVRPTVLRDEHKLKVLSEAFPRLKQLPPPPRPR